MAIPVGCVFTRWLEALALKLCCEALCTLRQHQLQVAVRCDVQQLLIFAMISLLIEIKLIARWSELETSFSLFYIPDSWKRDMKTGDRNIV